MLNRTSAHDVFEQLLEESNLADVRPQVSHSPGADPEAEAEMSEITTDEADLEESEGSDSDSSDLDDVAPGDTTMDDSGIRRWLLRVGAGVAALLFVGTTAAAGVLGWHVKQQNDIATAGRAATVAATAYAVTLTTVDYQKIDQNFAQVIEGATGEFKNMYSQSSAQLRQLLIDNKAVSHGTVLDSAIKSATKDTVDVLIFVDQSITNSVNPQPRIDRSRIAMTMQRIDGRWLASKIDIR